MLIQFNVKNFKSFKDEASLDLSSTKETELSLHIRNVGEEKVLPSAIIYGANASGKSNLLEALRYMQNYVMESITYGLGYGNKRFVAPIPFLFDEDSKGKPTSFEVFFTLPKDNSGILYQYGFSLDKEGIVEEWLNSKARTARKYTKMLYRDNSGIEIYGLPKKAKESLKAALGEKTLALSIGAHLKIDVLSGVFSFFANMGFVDFGNPVEDHLLLSQLPFSLDEDEERKEELMRYLACFDPSIVELRATRLDMPSIPDKLSFRVEAGHRVTKSDEIHYIPLQSESSGTLKMFALYPFVQEALKEGGVLVLDELSSRLHPLLARAFIQIFLLPETNPNNAQLLFATHDCWQLSSGIFRRDEIYFTDKDEEGASHLYSLAEFIGEGGKSIRSDENFEKNYLLGKYGAIPSLRSFAFAWRQDENGERE